MELKLYKDKDWILGEYLVKQQSENQIGMRCSVCSATIRNWLIRFGCQRRERSEAISLRYRNHIFLTAESLEFLNGLLLGDGHLERGSRFSAHYMQSSKFKSYLVWLSSELASLGLEQAGKINKRSIDLTPPYTGYTSYSYSSRAYFELSVLHSKWYRKARKNEKMKNGRPKKWIKILPQDLILTPLTVRQWHLGDGSITRKRSRWIMLNCQCFEPNEVNFLVKSLRHLGILATRRKDNGIQLSTKSTKPFLSYIGPCPVECYRYRWGQES